MSHESQQKSNALANIFLLGCVALAVVLGLVLLRRHLAGAQVMWFLLPLFSLAVTKSGWGRTAHSEVFRLAYIGATTCSIVMALIYLVAGYSAILDVVGKATFGGFPYYDCGSADDYGRWHEDRCATGSTPLEVVGVWILKWVLFPPVIVVPIATWWPLMQHYEKLQTSEAILANAANRR